MTLKGIGYLVRYSGEGDGDWQIPLMDALANAKSQLPNVQEAITALSSLLSKQDECLHKNTFSAEMPDGFDVDVLRNHLSKHAVVDVYSIQTDGRRLTVVMQERGSEQFARPLMVRRFKAAYEDTVRKALRDENEKKLNFTTEEMRM